MEVLAILVTAAVGLVAAVVVAGVGYWFGGRAERQRRKDSLKDDRLHDVRKAVDLLARLRAHAVTVRDRVGTVALYAEHAGDIQAGIEAADALGEPGLSAGIGEALGVLNSLINDDDNEGDQLNHELRARLTAVRHEYEALRDKLV